MSGRKGSAMRSDVKTLLEKLGKSQFRYKEFADRFSDLDTWPVFESIIRDPRIFNSELGTVSPSPQAEQFEAASLSSVLSKKYGLDDGLRVKAPATPVAADVRTLLARISSAVDKGTI
ncbi:hypothetical protein [Novosphingobium sp.]|uniref:hypothetical protein n=1 Tax=Novosphingobium sp. TaxID=1874826 RepID=UPI00261DD670|nr:hypothetical protein [Novosphingobium sp.]